jgi:hypothetical protein
MNVYAKFNQWIKMKENAISVYVFRGFSKIKGMWGGGVNQLSRTVFHS